MVCLCTFRLLTLPLLMAAWLHRAAAVEVGPPAAKPPKSCPASIPFQPLTNILGGNMQIFSAPSAAACRAHCCQKNSGKDAQQCGGFVWAAAAKDISCPTAPTEGGCCYLKNPGCSSPQNKTAVANFTAVTLVSGIAPYVMPPVPFNYSAVASFHPIAPETHFQSDCCGGLLDYSGWLHVFFLCHAPTGHSWCHLATKNLVDYVAYNDPTEPMGGTGSVQPLPDGSGRVIAIMNDFAEAGLSTDSQLRTWTGVPMTYKLDPKREYRDTARPLQSKSGVWFSHVGCNGGGQAAICQFRAENKQLSNWTFDRPIWSYNKTLFGRDANTCTVRQPGIAGARCPPECNGDAACCNLNGGWIVHAVEYVVGDWASDGSVFKPLTRGILDYGQFYSARTIADATNTGRRLIYGNIRTDVTQGPFGVNTTVCEAPPWSSATEVCPVWFFFALPRELSLGDDDRLLVKPPKELEQLRVPGSAVAKSVTSGALRCGQRMALGLNSLLAEVSLTLRWPQAAKAGEVSGWQRAGIYILGGGVSVGYELSTMKLILNASNSTTPPEHWGNGSRFLASPFAVNVSAVNNSVGFRVYLDKIVVEVFEERGRAVITQVTAPGETGASAEVGIFLECGNHEEQGAALPSFEAHAWELRPAPVRTMPVGVS